MGIKCPKCNTDNPDTLKFCGECGTQIIPLEEAPVTETLETPKEELTTGSTFAGRYQIIEELGKGGMGKVYKAQDTEIREKVALKLLRPEIASDKKTIERFQNELKFARKISHRNVCRMYDLNKEEGSYYITMEYVPGEDLKGMIRMVGKLGAGKSISIAKQVCEGLAEAHKLGVIHRDLKPQNIMIDREGNARIMDFGIARSLEAKGITRAGVMVGTPEYMSPEQAEVKEVDQRSDIYSLGVILYEMATGRVPFEGETPLGIAMKHKSEIPKDPREINAQIPEDLSQMILKCMEKDKEKRYQSAGEVRSELENVEKGIRITDRVIPKRKPITSKEITVTFGLKKLFIPALVFAALVIVAVIVWQILPQKGAVPISSGKHSVAVLPFVDLSPQKDQRYLCDGIAETLINALSNIKDLKVPARTSAFSFRDKEQDVHEIGKMLNVEAVLEGSVQKANNRIRITAQLINVEDGYHLWSEKFDRNMDDIFAIQDEISLAIVDNLKLKLLKGEKTKLVKSHTNDPEAYSFYLKGRYFYNKRTEEDMKRSVEYFELALDRDPKFVLPYAGLADTYATFGFYHWWPYEEARSKAKEFALKGLEVDDSVGETHAAYANYVLWFEWQWAEAEKEYKKAIELSPSDVEARHMYAHLFECLGRFDKAIAEMGKALELEPLSISLNHCMAQILFFAGNYDEAIDLLKKTIEMDPSFPIQYFWLGRVYLQKGKLQQAIEMFEKGANFPAISTNVLGGLGYAYATAGRRSDAKKILHQMNDLSKERFVDHYFIAYIHMGLGDTGKVFEHLEKGFEVGDMYLFYLKVDPIFNELHEDPRFGALMKKTGLDK